MIGSTRILCLILLCPFFFFIREFYSYNVFRSFEGRERREREKAENAINSFLETSKRRQWLFLSQPIYYFVCSCSIQKSFGLLLQHLIFPSLCLVHCFSRRCCWCVSQSFTPEESFLICTTCMIHYTSDSNHHTTPLSSTLTRTFPSFTFLALML